MKRVYLAGPGVFSADPIADGARLKALCTGAGLLGLHPLDSGLDVSTMDKPAAAQAIYRANIELIETADALIADMRTFRGPGMDGGTAFEMGYAKALGKPVVGYGLTDLYLDRCRAHYGTLRQAEAGAFDPDGLVVEDFDLVDNLMMACGADAIVSDEAEAVRRVAELLTAD